MFRRFKRGSGRGGARPSLNSVRFDTIGYAAQGEPEPDEVRIWRTPEGDKISLYFLPLPPDLPAHASSAAEFAAFYCGLLGDSGGKCVEASVITAGGCPAVRTILSVPRLPSGRTYVGSLTLPFRDFSFVLKCQCEERGPTGSKEALLLERDLAANEPIQIEGERLEIPNFSPDDPQYDAEFPAHPVARVRRVLAHVSESLVVAPEVRALPGFALPLNVACS